MLKGEVHTLLDIEIKVHKVHKPQTRGTHYAIYSIKIQQLPLEDEVLDHKQTTLISILKINIEIASSNNAAIEESKNKMTYLT